MQPDPQKMSLLPADSSYDGGGFTMIFISHDSRRIHQADLFKRLIVKHRNRKDSLPNIFLSSDGGSISSGELAETKVFARLKDCVHFAALICDSGDFDNRWIPFETAFVLGRNIEPKVFVFGQLEMKQIPRPLSAIQLIDTGNTGRVLEALLQMGVRWEDEA